MAAIIAQITREARARKIRKRYTLPINKSNYMIHPFKERFVPELDNPYLFRRGPQGLLHYKQAIKARVNELVTEEIAKQETIHKATKCGICCEIMLILGLLLFVPLIAYLVENTWPT